MPGLASMESNQTQPFLKHEQEEERDDFFDEEVSNDDNGTLYRPRPALSKSSVCMRSLKWLMKALENGLIDLEPEYQREVVWTADRMTGLINSLMENFYIPPIILNKKTNSLEDNPIHTHTLVCVDGKQRLSSVKAFIKGIIPCLDYRGEKWWFCDASASGRRKVLAEATRVQFLQKEFVSFEFTNLSPEQEEDLFARVQMGVQLTPAEKMRATTGPWQELARMFVDDFPTVWSLLKDRTRGREFQYALSCFSQILEVQNPTAANGIPMLKTKYTSLPKLLKNKHAVDDGIKSHLASVFTTFKELIEQDPNTFTNGDKRLRSVQTFAPIEMVAVVVLISQWSETRNNRLLLGDIGALRDNLREHFTDLRLNEKLWKHTWSYIDNLERIRGGVGTVINRNVRLSSRTASPGVQKVSLATTTPMVETARMKLATVIPKSKPSVTSNPMPEPSPPVLRQKAMPHTLLVDPRSHKRQRVDSGSENRTQTVFYPNLATLPGSSTTEPMVLDDSPALLLPILGKKPVPPSTISAAPKIQKARRSQVPIVGAGIPIPGNSRLIDAPEQAHRNRISAINNSTHAPVAPMIRPSFAPPTPVSLENRRFGPAPTPTPIRSFQELTNIVNSKKPVRPPSQHKSAGAFSRFDDTIDLTEDTEQERQNLLSQFKAPTARGNETRARAAEKPTPTEDLGTNPYKNGFDSRSRTGRS